MQDKFFYHILLKSKEGMAMFRCPEDYYYFINILATSGPQFHFNVVAYVCLPDQVQIAVESRDDVNNIKLDPKGFASKVCFRYTKYFTRKYGERGSVFCKPAHCAKYYKEEDIKVVLSQILRTPEKLKLSTTPFNYKYTSARYYFEEEFGRQRGKDYTFKVNALLSKNYPVPKGWKVLQCGMLDPHNWLDIRAA